MAQFASQEMQSRRWSVILTFQAGEKHNNTLHSPLRQDRWLPELSLEYLYNVHQADRSVQSTTLAVSSKQSAPNVGMSAFLAWDACPLVHRHHHHQCTAVGTGHWALSTTPYCTCTEYEVLSSPSVDAVKPSFKVVSKYESYHVQVVDQGLERGHYG